MGMTYLLHFDKPIHHARHYLGYAEESIERRVERHRKGFGARLTQVAMERGIKFEVARTWEGVDRHFERSLKRKKSSPKLCPICNPAPRGKIFDEGLQETVN